MGSVGDCYDNAVIESFWGRMQTELLKPETMEHARRVGLSDVRIRRGVPRPAAPPQLDRDGSWLVELASVTSADSVDQALAEVLRVQEVGDRTLTESIVGALVGRQLLLILDNCEHVVDAVVNLVEALLVRCEGVAILASSREALGLRGERVCPVDPLGLPEAGQPAADSAAVQLFVERWSASDPLATIDDGAIATVAEICERLDGMPLAIELAAARVRGLGIESLAERLDGALRLLRSNRGEDRHRTLRAVVAWSFDRLEPHLRDLLCRAGVFAGGFTLGSAEAVLAFGGLDEIDVADGVAALVDKSMIQVVDTPLGKRHRLLETMRQFGTEHIRVEDRAVVERRFTERMANLAASIDIGLSGPDPRRWFDKGAAEIDNFREACRLGLEHGWHEQTATILISLTEFAMRRIVGEVFVLMAELGRRLPAGHELELRVMAAAVFNAHTRGDTALAEQFFARFESVESATPDQIEPEVLARFGAAYWMLGRTDRAIDLQRGRSPDSRLRARCIAPRSRCRRCRWLKTRSIARKPGAARSAPLSWLNHSTRRTCSAAAS